MKEGGGEISFSAEGLEAQVESFSRKGITEFMLHDKQVCGDKGRLLRFLRKAARFAPETFVSFSVEPKLVDRELIEAASQVPCSLNVNMGASVRVAGNSNPVLMLDRKLFCRKAALLNGADLVFGFNIGLGRQSGDSYKAFCSRLDLALGLYPNHVNLDFDPLPAPTGLFSDRDIARAAELAFACHTFYNAGRAVPWFLAAIGPLKILPSRFLADFAEWQRCNSCGFKSAFDADSASHAEIERMQLRFLEMKYEERRLQRILAAVNDIVRLNGAFARASFDGEESVLDLSYSPEDIFSPCALHPAEFAENVCMERCRARVFAASGGAEWELV